MTSDLDPSPNNPPDTAPDELTEKVPLAPRGQAAQKALLPALIAIAFCMLALGAVVCFGVVGGHFPPLFLLISALFVSASFGLLRLFRWAWALTLAATFLLMSYCFWGFASTRQPSAAVEGLLGMVIFFYLVRVDVRSRLR